MQRLLGPTQREVIVAVTSNYTAGGTSLTFTDTSASAVNTGMIIPGVMLSCDLEVFLVTGPPVGGSVPVMGAYLGSTAANHTAGTLIYVKRRFTDFECLQQINHVLDELGGEGLYNLGTIQFTYNPVQQAYDLTDINNGAITGYIEGVSVRCLTPLPDRKMRTVPANHWEVQTNVSDDTNFPSGYALTLNDWNGPWPGQNILFQFKQSFVHLTSATANVQTTALLPATANDLPPMGAMLRMVPPALRCREIRCKFNRTHDHQAPEVPPAAVAGFKLTRFALMYEMLRINEEKSPPEKSHRPDAPEILNCACGGGTVFPGYGCASPIQFPANHPYREISRSHALKRLKTT